MSQLDIQQHDAKRLAAGYKKSFRLVEILAILSFWSLSLAIAVRAFPFHHTHPWVLVAGVVSGFLFADFVSGFVHWMADTWGSADMPILGKSLVRPFREHHVDQKAMTHHDYIETNGANCLVSLPVAAGVLFIPLNIEGWVRWKGKARTMIASVSDQNERIARISTSRNDFLYPAASRLASCCWISS